MNTKKRLDTTLWLVPVVAIGYMVVLLIAYVWKFDGAFSDEQSTWGQFGDFLGGALNPVLAFLTLVLLLLTIRLQREELELSRKEMERSASALEEQSKSFARQNFENMLFGVTEQFQSFVQSAVFQSHIGRDGLRWSVGLARNGYVQAIVDQPEIPREEQARRAFLGLYVGYQFFPTYFRMLYHVFKLIDSEAQLSDSDKRRYASLVRAQFSADELLILFYNCAFPPGSKGGLKTYVDKYRLLKHLDRQDLFEPENRELVSY